MLEIVIPGKAKAVFGISALAVTAFGPVTVTLTKFKDAHVTPRILQRSFGTSVDSLNPTTLSFVVVPLGVRLDVSAGGAANTPPVGSVADLGLGAEVVYV